MAFRIGDYVKIIHDGLNSEFVGAIAKVVEIQNRGLLVELPPHLHGMGHNAEYIGQNNYSGKKYWFVLKRDVVLTSEEVCVGQLTVTRNGVIIVDGAPLVMARADIGT